MGSTHQGSRFPELRGTRDDVGATCQVAAYCRWCDGSMGNAMYLLSSCACHAASASSLEDLNIVRILHYLKGLAVFPGR